MPSPATEHEGLIQLFRHEPEFAALLLDEQSDIDLPNYGHVQVLTEEYKADAVIVLNNKEGPALAIVVEVLLNRDSEKRWVWPTHLIGARSRERCQVALLVICPRAPIATWCATPITLGPGWELRPTVIGPKEIPIITDPDTVVSSLELALLSALAHGHAFEGDPVTHALLSAVEQQPGIERLREYAGVVLAVRPHAKKIAKEVQMAMKISGDSKNPYDQFLIELGKEWGKADATARSILLVLRARGMDFDDEQRSQIERCENLEQLDRWLQRAAVGEDAEELFG